MQFQFQTTPKRRRKRNDPHAAAAYQDISGSSWTQFGSRYVNLVVIYVVTLNLNPNNASNLNLMAEFGPKSSERVGGGVGETVVIFPTSVELVWTLGLTGTPGTHAMGCHQRLVPLC